MNEKDEPHGPASPVCYAVECETIPTTWPQIRAWRKGRREELIAQRMARTAGDRLSLSQPVIEYLRDMLKPERYPLVGLYWPIRGEIDLREFALNFVAAGGIVGLPVVIQSDAPVEFWRWQPGVVLKRGRWNIPVPPERELVRPEVLVVPLVGFDARRYRLGYGGGFYDRTLAAAVRRPLTIGIAFADVELPNIHPQPHDIPMDVIVTEKYVWGTISF
jgi:5-formyltetrahydrofolate cyclo-ligase